MKNSIQATFALASCVAWTLAGAASSSDPATQVPAVQRHHRLPRSPEIHALRAEFEQQLKALQQAYEVRLQEIETRLSQINEANGTDERSSPPPLRVSALPETSLPSPSSSSGVIRDSATAFNPEISLILQGSYGARRSSPNTTDVISGFIPATDEIAPRGFSLGESELVLASNIGPYARGQLNLAAGEETVAVEEAWFQTLELGGGLGFKAGRYASGVGYANAQHPHSWDFADASLMQRVLFGERWRQEGVQLKWLVPTEQYLELGAEAGRGQFFPGSVAGGNRNGAGSWALFAHTGGDVDVAHSWRAGLGYLTAHPHARTAELEDAAGTTIHTVFSGDTRIWLADFVWKWAPQGNSRVQNLKLQAEIFRRTERGQLACDDNQAAGGLCHTVTGTGGMLDDYRSRQSGAYIQAVYQFMPAWRVGYRHDRLDAGTTDFGRLPLSPVDFRPQRRTLMTDYAPGEFSRFRLQLAQENLVQGRSDHQLLLQYIHSLGAHGAHAF